MKKSKELTHDQVFIRLANQVDVIDTRLDHILKTISETIAQTLDVDQVSIWQFSPVHLEAKCMVVHSRIDTQKPSHLIDLTPHSLYRTALQTEVFISCADMGINKRMTVLPQEFWMIPDIQSCLHIPIRVTNNISGILRLDMCSERTWSQEDIHFCIRIADLVSQVLLTDALNTINQRDETLRSISTDITHLFELPSVMNSVVRRCVETLHGSYGNIFMADPVQKQITSTANYNTPEELSSQVFRYGEDVVGKVVETGQELLIKDYRTWSGRIEAAKESETPTSVLCVPIQARGKTIGVLQVRRENGDHFFTQEDCKTSIQFANLASLAIEHHQITESNSRLKHFQQTLNKITETATYSSNAVDFIKTTIDYLIHALGVSLAVIRFDDIVSTRGLSSEADKKIGAILRERGKLFDMITVVHDLNVSDDGYPDLAETMKRLRTQAYILAPVMINHDRLGYVCVASETGRKWVPEEIEMIELATNQIGLAIEGIRFSQETQSQIEMIKQLTAVTTSINRLVPVKEMVPMIGQGAVRLFNTDRLVLMLREQDEQVRASWIFGIQKPEFSQLVIKDGQNLLDQFVTNIEPVLITNISKSSLPQRIKKYLTTEGVNSVRMAPLIYSGNVIGLIAGFYATTEDWPVRNREMITAFTNTAALALQNVWMYKQLEKGYMDLALTLADVINARDTHIKVMPQRVAEWAQHTAQLLGLSDDDQEAIRWAALLHDIGKVEVPEKVLQKPESLKPEEWKLLHHYPVKSERLVSPLTRFKEVGSILRNIRERYDGKGYPNKLQGEDIPLSARILSVADAYGSMIDERPYRQARSHEEAVQEIMDNSGKQFDPMVVNTFLQTVNQAEAIH